MKKMKSANHHWWPECVSKHWADSQGFTNWIIPDGTIKKVPPAKLGMIGNGHHIKLNSNPANSSPFDMSFENEFEVADSNFPAVIEWLNILPRKILFKNSLKERFLPQRVTDEKLKTLTESVVSLLVRNPQYRISSVSIAKRLRGSIPKSEEETLIGLSIRHSQRMISDSIGCDAKFVILFSSGTEFTFGDGFFHNLAGIISPIHDPKMVVPITPEMSVVISKPSSYNSESKLSTLVLTEEEVETCNHAVQIYSKNSIFYRSDRPTLTTDFTCGQYLEYGNLNHPFNMLIDAIP